MLGLMADAWHPGWLIFFAIPISGIIVKMFTSDREEGAHNAGPPRAADQRGSAGKDPAEGILQTKRSRRFRSD